MAAEVLATAGVGVVVFEHTRSVGRKLLLAGRGGLNLTHTEALDALLARYGPAEPRLRAAVEGFGPDDLRAWASSLGQPTFVGSSGRVFPEAFRATPLLRAWLGRLAGLGVSVKTGHRWIGWADPDGDGETGRAGDDAPVRLRFARADAPVREVATQVAVLALGGASWPRTGSDAEWVPVLRGAGVTVHDLRPANVGVRVAWTRDFADRVAGRPLKNVAVSLDGTTARGDVIITDTGLESGPIYAHSAAIRAALDREVPVRLTIDLAPDSTEDQLAERLDRRRPKDSLASTLRRTLGLSTAATGLLREATGNRLPSDSVRLAALVKAVPVDVTGTEGLARAISSSGGIALDEIDDTFMLLRRPGTFVAGEMLDWEAPTGGYLLQATFSTAVAAARGALARLGVSGEAAPPWP
jgi:uncharacterized flavoprotein (TIGR03862 family)